MAGNESKVDVLIVGAGPAGLMLSLWMSRLGVKTRVVDKRTAKIFSGQADGFQCRTLEILDSFGIGERVWKEANHMLEVCFWNPDSSGMIRRTARAPDTIPGLSRFSEVVLHQGRMEQFFLDAIRASYATDEEPSRVLRVERCTLPTSLEIDEAAAGDFDNPDAYPVRVTLRRLTEDEAAPTQRLSNLSDGIFRSNLADSDIDDLLRGSRERAGEEEIVRAKFVVGCDGAHSWVRKSLGKHFEMKGEMSDYIWGVLDIVPITDFPDIRNRSMIHSANHGALMVIPRENKLVRLYIQLKEVSAGGGRVDRSQITPELIFKAAQKILHPYKLDYHYCDWWTAYQIGQRVGDHFSKLNRVFLAGDAVHTHSPKAGQGMNVSMQDTYNLGWKLGLAVHNIVRPDVVLPTYSFERKQIARDLIDFDQKFSKLFTGKPAEDILDETGVSMDIFTDAFHQSHLFTTGIGIEYKPSILVARTDDGKAGGGGSVAPEVVVAGGAGERESDDDEKFAMSSAKSRPGLADKCRPGMRFPSFQVLSQADSRPWQLHHKMPSDGRFRLVVFPGNISPTYQKQRKEEEEEEEEEEETAGRRSRLAQTNRLGAWLADTLLPRYPRINLSPGWDPHSSTIRYRTEKSSRPSVIDVFIVHSAPREEVELLRDLHAAFHPFDDKLGWEYDRVFVDGESYHEGHGHAYDGYGINESEGAVVVVRPDGYIGLVVGLENYDDIQTWFDGVLRRV